MLDTVNHTVEKIDPRVKRTRKLILDAFLSLQAEKGFDDITIQDITTRATVNRATFYAHFADKYALLDEQIRAGFAQILQQRLSPRTTSVQEHLRQLLLAVTDHWTAVNKQCQHTYRLFESLVEAQVKVQVRDSLRGWLSEHHHAQASHPERLELAATIVSWAIYGAAMEWSKHVSIQAAETFADEALPLIAASITALNRSLR